MIQPTPTESRTPLTDEAERQWNHDSERGEGASLDAPWIHARAIENKLADLKDAARAYFAAEREWDRAPISNAKRVAYDAFTTAREKLNQLL